MQPLTPELEQALKAKDSFKECDVCPEMVVVPKGSFMMGTPADEPDRSKGEDPIHRVSFAKPFAVGRFTISFDEWDACLADGGCGGIKGDDKGFGRGRMPAQGINFEAAKLYLAWLSKKVGRTYRLPSESEREYFTRAGTTTPFWFGNTITAQNASYKASIPYGNGPRGVDSKGPAVVDSYAPNPFGLYQVHGNVFEWTEGLLQQALQRRHAGRRLAMAGGRLPQAHAARRHLGLVGQHGALGLSRERDRRRRRLQLSRGADAERAMGTVIADARACWNQ